MILRILSALLALYFSSCSSQEPQPDTSSEPTKLSSDVKESSDVTEPESQLQTDDPQLEPTPPPTPPVTETPEPETPEVVTSHQIDTTAAQTAYQNVFYQFKPFVPENLNEGIEFEILNTPEWASFSAATGSIEGFPPYPGLTTNVSISTNKPNTVTAAPFDIQTKGDPLTDYAWHIKNTGQSAFSDQAGEVGADLNVLEVWSMGLTGKGVKVAISDQSAELSHEDLVNNLLTGESKDYNSSPPYYTNPELTSNDLHATAVAGIILAEGWNEKGTIGVAPNAQFASLNFLSAPQTSATRNDQVTGDFDIFNQSWGLTSYYVYHLSESYKDQLIAGVSSLRSGLGAIYIKAAGNGYNLCASQNAFCSQNVNLDPYNTTPYTINVGALNAEDKKSSYSSTGSGVWISGYGGEYGKDTPAVITTDRSGCDIGYSKESSTKNDFEDGHSLNPNCDYTSTFNGTSSATPTVSGVVALMLEANPSLSWRDVKHILANTATLVDPEIVPIKLESTDFNYEEAWTVNSAGYAFHNWYGFGKVNALSAVNMAKSYTSELGTFTQTVDEDGDWKFDSGPISIAIPDNDLDGVTTTIEVTDNLVIEALQLELSATHSYVADLAFELTSPSGTKSIVLNSLNTLASEPDMDALTVLSNAFYGESSAGTWTLKVIDILEQDNGSLTNWKINIYGH
jgi:subtilisin family serine protease